jgi:hypothetical protein
MTKILMKTLIIYLVSKHMLWETSEYDFIYRGYTLYA